MSLLEVVEVVLLELDQQLVAGQLVAGHLSQVRFGRGVQVLRSGDRWDNLIWGLLVRNASNLSQYSVLHLLKI